MSLEIGGEVSAPLPRYLFPGIFPSICREQGDSKIANGSHVVTVSN